jgi:hypothetical protein
LSPGQEPRRQGGDASEPVLRQLLRAALSIRTDGARGDSSGRHVREPQWSDETREAGHYRQERWFERALWLPIPVENGQVKATYRDGVPTVKLPKTEGVKPKEIKIDAA